MRMRAKRPGKSQVALQVPSRCRPNPHGPRNVPSSLPDGWPYRTWEVSEAYHHRNPGDEWDFLGGGMCLNLPKT